jgi:hypothetical protein
MPVNVPRVEGDPDPLVPTWVRVLVICTVIPVWCALMIYSLTALKKLPGAEWTIVPSGVIAAVAPSWRVRRAGAAEHEGGGGQ